MRQQRTTTLILAISLALFANAALAQRASTGAGASARASGTVGAAPMAAGPATGAANVNGTANANGNVSIGTPATAGTSTNSGSSTVVTTSTSNGSTSPNGSASPNGSTSPGVVPSGVANLQARLFDANGNLLTDRNGNAFVTDGVSVIGTSPMAAGFEGATIGVDASQIVVANASLVPATGTAVSVPTPELDRATRKELAKARQASRSNRQLLTTIAPRTSVDRTDQMADDPLPARY